MQHRYSGDIGDFGKFLLLKTLFPAHIIGTVWYLYPDESHNSDGRHTVEEGNKGVFPYCVKLDRNMSRAFHLLHQEPIRHVGLLEEANLIPNGVYFTESILGLDTEYGPYRSHWLEKALGHIRTHQCGVVCLDPDNGIEPPSKARASAAARGKYATMEEIEAFFQIDTVSHCVIYQHPHRMKSHDLQAKDLYEKFTSLYRGLATVTVIRHNPVQPRFYIILTKTGTQLNHLERLGELKYGKTAFFSTKRS